jgi:hypothetical protein
MVYMPHMHPCTHVAVRRQSTKDVGRVWQGANSLLACHSQALQRGDSGQTPCQAALKVEARQVPAQVRHVIRRVLPLETPLHMHWNLQMTSKCSTAGTLMLSRAGV